MSVQLARDGARQARHTQISTHIHTVNWFTVRHCCAPVWETDRGVQCKRESEKETCLQYGHFWEYLLLRPQKKDYKPRISSTNVTYPPCREIDSPLWIQVKAMIPNWLCPLNPPHSWQGDADETEKTCYRRIFLRPQGMFIVNARWILGKSTFAYKVDERCEHDAGLLQAAWTESWCISMS